jgi:hypothetical protein
MKAGQILYELDRWDEEEVPSELLLAAVDEQTEITPDLIAAIEDATKNPATFLNDPSHQLYYWAIYLLAHFNATEAFPAVLEFFKLNGADFAPIVSDIIDEDGAMILANLCGGKIEPLCEILRDPQAPEPNRCAVTVALGFLCVWGELDRARVETEYRRAFENLDENSSFLAVELVNGATDLNLRGLGPDVTRAHDRGFVSDDDFEFAAEWLHDDDFVPPPPYMHLVQGIDDIVEFFENKFEESQLLQGLDGEAEGDEDGDDEDRRTGI